MPSRRKLISFDTTIRNPERRTTKKKELDIMF